MIPNYKLAICSKSLAQGIRPGCVRLRLKDLTDIFWVRYRFGYGCMASEMLWGSGNQGNIARVFDARVLANRLNIYLDECWPWLLYQILGNRSQALVAVGAEASSAVNADALPHRRANSDAYGCRQLAQFCSRLQIHGFDCVRKMCSKLGPEIVRNCSPICFVSWLAPLLLVIAV